MYLLELVGEDDRFSLAEAATAVAGARLAAPGVATAEAVDRDRCRRLARTRAVATALATAEGDESALLDAVRAASLPAPTSVAVRARDVRALAGIDTRSVERRVGRVFADRGHAIDLESPSGVCRVLASRADGTVRWFVGWVVVEPDRSFGTRAPTKRPFQQPGTMDPQLARTVVNLAGADAGCTFLDPMCGPGATLIEAALLDVTPVGIDVQRRMVEGARRNVAAIAPGAPPARLVVASAGALPVRRVDAAAFDAPYGRQSPIAGRSAVDLVRATLEELLAVTPRCVAVFDEPVGDLARRVGWRVDDTFERPVHRSLTRYVSLLERPG